MDKKRTDKNQIFHFSKPIESKYDIDMETAELLKNNFNNELTTLRYVENGEYELLKEYLANNNFSIHLGYSTVPLGNERAFANRALSLASNAAIKGGLDCVIAYTLIYNFQNEIEKATSSEKLLSLVYEILMEFCRSVGWTKIKMTDFPALQPVFRYIHRFVNAKITVSQIAAAVNMNENYLSQVFKKQTGQNITNYIQQTKIDVAKNLLLTTSMTYSEISNYLAFSSQSYFNKIFKKIVDTTPKQYRTTNQI